MLKKRQGYKVVVHPSAKARMELNQCACCGKPKDEWPKKRRRSWACCSIKCTTKNQQNYKWYGWGDVRQSVLERDNFTCKKCGKRPNIDGIPDKSQLVVDHIVPIALGGDEWDFKNLQVLCRECNRCKTEIDIGNIAEIRKLEKIRQFNRRLDMIHKHKWKNDDMFDCGAVHMICGGIDDLQEEMRQTCECGAVRFVKKEGSEPFSLREMRE